MALTEAWQCDGALDPLPLGWYGFGGEGMSGGVEHIADANRARIMRALVDHGPLSRVEIAQVSGLSPATVTRNIAYLMTVGVLAEDTTRVRTGGRSRIPVTVNAAYGRIAIVGLTHRGATLYQYDMALEPCAEPISLGEGFASADLPRTVEAHLSRADGEFEKTLRAVGVLRCDNSWDAACGLSDALSRRLGVPAFEQRAEDCAEYKILHDESEEASSNHLLVSLGSEVLVGIAQGGKRLPLRSGSYAEISRPLANSGEPEGAIVDRLVDILSILTSLFAVDAIFMMGSGEETLIAGVPVDLGNVAKAGGVSGELPRVVIVSQTLREMARIMTAQVRGMLLHAG